MDIRIECMAGDPPVWKVFLGEFFWSCDSREEAETWAAKAEAYIAFYSRYRLPTPLPPAMLAAKRPNTGGSPQPSYSDVAADGSAHFGWNPLK